MSILDFYLFVSFIFFCSTTKAFLLSRIKNPMKYIGSKGEEIVPESFDDPIDNDFTTEIPDYLYKSTDLNVLYSRKTLKTTILKKGINRLVFIHATTPLILTTKYKMPWPSMPLITTLYVPLMPTTKRESSTTLSLPTLWPSLTKRKTTSANSTFTFSWKTLPIHLEISPVPTSMNIEDHFTKTIVSKHINQSRGRRVAKCYIHHNDIDKEDKIPIPTNEIFSDGDFRVHYRARYRRYHCHYSTTYYSIQNKLYGPFIGGCFKRFLDISDMYTERGCRTKKPVKTGSYASQKFAVLEKMLKGVSDGCVSTPYASLTPFSRSISLYARYNVCVCSSRYCNKCSEFGNLGLWLLFLSTGLYLVFNK